jgi:N-acetylneuraminate synthase/N,N'-diacetyllegionaminate synthase
VSASIEIGRHRIGPGHPCFVIAEVGVNHNGDVGLARELIDAAADAGAEAVKFQTFTPELLAATDAPKAQYPSRDGAPSQRDMLERLRLGPREHADLKSHAEARGLVFLSSPFDDSALQLLVELGVAGIKIGSGELTNHPLLAAAAATGLPIVLSTGMASINEVEAAVEALGTAASRTALLHCVSSYPAAPEDCNLRAMNVLRERFGTPVGWSDHTEGIAVAEAAVALGADIVEKHITLDRSMTGPDHAASIEPREFAELVRGVRTIERALGEPVKRPAESEREIAAVARKSLHWRRAILPGTSIDSDDLIALRPGTGIPPSKADQIVGQTVVNATVAGTMVKPEDLADLSRV